MAAGLALGAAAAVPRITLGAEPPGNILGPIVGHTEATMSVLWMRAAAPGEYTLEVSAVEGGATRRVSAMATEAADLCVHWRVEGLQPATEYRYRVLRGGEAVSESGNQVFRTAPDPDRSSRVRLAFSSCAREDAGSRAVWNRMAAEGVEAVVLIGDTPYIDSTTLEVQTRRHREFAAVPEYQRLLASRPCWWTWDDHDFGANDASGLLPGKENSRLVYTRYRPQRNFGDGTDGIYTSFRYGPMEVFLLDTRWFAMTEASFAAGGQPTLLGAKQWAWLQEGLRRSKATFKVLACGMIWDDKENSEKDDWGTYLAERRALERFILTERIPGVILMGGDIHASRVLRYNSKAAVGYDLVQFIASPVHGSVIPSLNVYNPHLVRSAVEPHVFLLVEADDTVSPARLDATLINARGARVFHYQLTIEDLTPA